MHPGRETAFAPTSSCLRCIYRLHATANCVAFPAGVPPAIRDGCTDHTLPYPGDDGFQFVPAAWANCRRAWITKL